MFDESIIQWVQPWTCSHFWVSLPCTLLPGNRSCSATGWCHSGPRPKPTNWQWGQIREGSQPVAGDWWVCGGEGCKSWIRAFCWSPPDRSLALGQWVRWKAHGTAGGCVPQSSRALAKVTHCWAPSVGPHPSPIPIWVVCGAGAPVGLSFWLPHRWQWVRVWEPGPEGAANWDLPPLSQGQDPGGWKLDLETCQNRE